MSEGEELLASGEGVSWRPGFELALRGYDKRQVDQFVLRVDGEMSSLVAERERAFGQVRDLSARLEQVQAELVELRQRPVQVERASFRDLGPTVDQILALAEQQAKTITDDGGRWAAEQRAEAERVLAEARQRADRLRADSEAVCERAELEARRVDEQSARQVEQARAEAEGLVQEARAQAREQVEAAREQTEQEVQARQQALAGLQAELDTAQQQLGQSRQEGAVVEREVAGLQQRLDEVGQQLAAELDRLDEARRAADSAERHATQVRARVQREAERVAQLAAAAVMAAAARGAETGEYPMVVPVRSGTNGVADQGIEAPAGIIAPDPAAGIAPDPAAGTDNRGHTSHDTDHAVPTQREPQPEELARHTE